MGGSNRVYLEARARVLPMAKRRWYSSSSFLSFLSFFSLVRFPLKQKNQRNNNEHERNSLSFPFGHKRREHGEGPRASSQPRSCPQPLKKDKKGQGPPFPSYVFLVFFVVEEDGERRRRRNRQDCIFNGKSKDNNGREMKKG